MATRKKDIHIESGGAPNEFYLWTDLSAKQVESIEGIVRTYVHPTGDISITIDPRYDVQSVKDEIYALAGVETLG